MNTTEQIRRGQIAAAEFPTTSAAFADVREAMIKAFFDSPETSIAERERLYQAVRVLDAVRTQMVGYMSAGQHQEKAKEIAERIGAGPLP